MKNTSRTKEEKEHQHRKRLSPKGKIMHLGNLEGAFCCLGLAWKSTVTQEGENLRRKILLFRRGNNTRNDNQELSRNEKAKSEKYSVVRPFI